MEYDIDFLVERHLKKYPYVKEAILRENLKKTIESSKKKRYRYSLVNCEPVGPGKLSLEWKKAECVNHSYSWNGSMPMTGVYCCVYCGKREDHFTDTGKAGMSSTFDWSPEEKNR